MRKSLLTASLALAMLPLSGCMTDGYFWYRPNAGVSRYERGGREHFRRETQPPTGNFRHLEGNVHRPQPGMRASSLPRGNGPSDGGRGEGGRRGGHHRP